MLRIILFVILVLLAIPLFNKGKEYWDDKIHKAEAIGKSVEKAVRYSINGK